MRINRVLAVIAVTAAMPIAPAAAATFTVTTTADTTTCVAGNCSLRGAFSGSVSHDLIKRAHVPVTVLHETQA